MKPATLRVPTEPANSTDHLDLSKAVRVTLPNLKPTAGSISPEPALTHAAPHKPSAHTSLPGPTGRLHPLTGDRSGELSLDLEHPNRLLLVAAHDPVPLKLDGGLDWEAVTAVEIIEITDTHV